MHQAKSAGKLRQSAGFTLLEVMVAVAIGAVFSALSISCIASAVKLMQRSEIETRVRQPMAFEFRLFEQAIRGAEGTNSVVIRANYTDTGTTAAGSCAYISNPNFGHGCAVNFAIYYYNPTPKVPETGAIYLTPDTSKGAPNPANDRRLFTNVLSFECRQGINQEIHLGLLGTVRASPRESATSPGNTVLLTSSVIRRTPVGSS